MSGEGTALAESLGREWVISVAVSAPPRVEVAQCAQQRQGGVPREGTGCAQVTLTGALNGGRALSLGTSK